MAGKPVNNPIPKKGTSRAKSTSNRSKFRWFNFILKLIAAGILLLFLLFLLVYLGVLGKVPSTAELNVVKTPMASEVFSDDGKVLGRYYIENRSSVSYKEISPNIIQALIATEDARFYEHRGIDEFALIRVFIKTFLFQDRSAGGGSTLSQQIAKNLYPRPKNSKLTIPVSKIREAIVAYRLERIYTKEEILTLYLNTVPFGENIFGIEVAAERFFSKKPNEITVPEAAVLVGTLKANFIFNPRLHPEKSLERRNVVLDQMVKQKFITKDECEKYKSTPLGLNYRLITYNQGPAPYLLERIRPQLQAWCNDHTKSNGLPYNLYTDGLKIYTTLDFSLQQYARNAVNAQMKKLQGVFDEHWKGRSPWGKDNTVVDRAIKRTDRYRAAKTAGKSDEQIREEFKKPVAATLFTWDGGIQKSITPLDSVKHYISMLNAGFLAMEPNTGDVKAWIGGINFMFFKYDYCTAPRQVGSTFKPVIYLAGLESGLSPLDYYSNEKKTYSDYQDWSPTNSHDDYTGYYTMKAGLARSINTVSVDIMMQTGIENAIGTARNLGVQAELPPFPSLALGVASISLQEMVSTYATMVNGGAPVKPRILVKIEDKDGNILETFEVVKSVKNKVDPENCRIIIEMLRSTIDGGTGNTIRSIYHIPGDFAGKTGTTQDHADGWFIGMNPALVAGCWVGADDPAVHFRSMTYGQGAYMALPVVGNFFSQLYANPRFNAMAQLNFDRPDPETVEELNALADYRETIEDDDFNLFDIFRRKDKPADNQPDTERRKPKGSDERPVWERIKDIFKKK